MKNSTFERFSNSKFSNGFLKRNCEVRQNLMELYGFTSNLHFCEVFDELII